MRQVRIVFSFLLLLMLAGCSQKQEQTQSEPPAQPAAEQQPPAQPAPPQQAETPPGQAESTQAAPGRSPVRPAERSASAKTAPAMNPRTGAVEPVPRSAATSNAMPPGTSPTPAAAPVPPRPKIAVIPAGTKLTVRLVEPIDSAINKTGDTFQATLDNDLLVDGSLVAPRGSTVTGKLTQVLQSGRVQGLAQMSLALRDLRVGDAVYPIQSNVLSFQAESTKNKDAAKVGIGAGIGAAIGAIAGGGKGAAIGAAVGGGAGGATVLASRGKELKFPAEHQLTFSLRSEVNVTLR